MRSRLSRFSLFAPPLALAIGLTLAACGDAQRSMDSQAQRDPSGSPEAETPGTHATSDASAAGPSRPVKGSPLCGVTADTCLPDDDGTMSSSVVSCASATGPSGAEDEDRANEPSEADAGDAGDASRPAARVDACRLAGRGGEVAPVCFRAETGAGADPTGTDGASCETGEDCAAGFDCVDGEKGSVCRRYCCLGSCEEQVSLSGGPMFCDTQTLVAPEPRLAPVCMPIKSCTLLGEGECGERETCAVVTETGATSCVAIGPAQDGDPCDEQHCDAGLTCLGTPGHRHCYKLCRTDRSGSDCGRAKVCTTGSAFQDHGVGVCKDL